ncbi:MAG: hypothetical protein U0V73_09625 [Acidimicrobiia bacterium]
MSNLRSSLLPLALTASTLALAACDGAAHASRAPAHASTGESAGAGASARSVTHRGRATRGAGTTPSTAPAVVARRVPTPDHPLRVLLVGDSVAGSLSPGLAHALAGTGARFEDRTYPGFGLTATSPGFLDDGTPWPSRFQEWPSVIDRTVRTFDPDVVIAYLGNWDALDRVAFGRRIRALSPEWAQWYHDVLDLYARDLTARGAHLYWVRLTRDVRPEQQRVNDAINRQFDLLAQRMPDRVTILSVDGAIVPNGPYVQQQHLPDGRSVDVWKLLHLTPEGADLAGRAVVHDLAATWGLPR